MMKRFAVKEVFDIEVYGTEGLLFKINTAKEVSLYRDFEKVENTLIVKDALLKTDVLIDILNGRYDNKHLRIKGISVFRDDETCKDYPVELNITVAKLSKYSFPCSCMDVSVINMEFDFPTKDVYGFMNANLEVKNNEK